jgi:hypothetical protein
MMQPSHSLNTVVNSVRVSAKLDKAGVEQMLGVKLVGEAGSDAFNFYSASGGQLDGMAVTAIDYREPKPGSDATAGSMLNLKVKGKCPKRSDLEARFGKLTLTGYPRGKSLDEESSWSRIEPWGRLSFGFAERNPDCLSSITFAMGERA